MSKETQVAAGKSDHELVDELKAMRSRELDLLTRSLIYLNEVHSRKLDLKMGSDSLYTFAENVLGYTHDEAYLRIRAAEVLRFAPEFEEHLHKGRISMSALKSAQVSFRTEDRRRKKEEKPKLQRAEKIAVLNEILKSSARRAARVLAEKFPEHDKEKDQERVRPLSGGRYLLQVVIDEQTFEELQRLKEMTAHTNPQGKSGVVIGRCIRETCEGRSSMYVRES